jgi:hypothetical protein
MIEPEIESSYPGIKTVNTGGKTFSTANDAADYVQNPFDATLVSHNGI